MKRTAMQMAAVISLAGLSACSTWFPAEVKPPPAGRVSIVYSGNVDGEIEPCG